MDTRLQKLKICEREEVQFEGVPAGDLRYAATVAVYTESEPTADDIIKVARGAWLYKPFWISLSIDRLPVDLYFSIHTHHTLRQIKREFLWTATPMLKFKSGTSEGFFKATLDNYIYLLVLLLLPGDSVYLDFSSKVSFRGSIRFLNCGFFRSWI
jgi:hypothetical protein